MANPNMKFKDMGNRLWSTYGRATKGDVNDNKDRLTTTWQPQQGFEALAAQIETCLVYSHSAKRDSPDGDLIEAFLILSDQADGMLLDRLCEVGAAPGEQTTGLDGREVLMEDGVP